MEVGIILTVVLVGLVAGDVALVRALKHVATATTRTAAVSGTSPGAGKHPDPLGILGEARERGGETLELAARHLDPSLVDVLRIIGFDEEYVSARGSYLYDAGGRAYLDLHTGEGFASLGHNHPDVARRAAAALGEDLLDGVQIHYSALAGMLARGALGAPPATASTRSSSRAPARRPSTRR